MTRKSKARAASEKLPGDMLPVGSYVCDESMPLAQGVVERRGWARFGNHRIPAYIVRRPDNECFCVFHRDAELLGGILEVIQEAQS